MNEQNKSRNLPRDVFLYLLAIITLITVAISFGIVIFQIINIYIPDVVADQYLTRSSYLGSLRSSLATLIIVFPVFLWVSRFLKKDIIKFPEKKDLKIRKWLLYLTLFIAALVIIGDLVALLRSFLDGELTQRFTLKIFAILFIAGSVFVHYLSELKDDENKFGWVPVFDWVVIGAVIAAIVCSFLVAGSPQNQRMVRMDEQRVMDLQSIQWQIINYWQKKGAIPTKLEDLSDPISGFVIPMDPETGMAYEYKQTGNLKFELCSNFSTVSEDSMNNIPVARPVMDGGAQPATYQKGQDVWSHGQGKICFERLIDPQLYPPVKN